MECTPAHLCWQYQIADRIAFEGAVAHFKVHELAAPVTYETHTPFYSGDNLFLLLILTSTQLLKPSEGQFSTAFNQKGNYFELGIKGYFRSQPGSFSRFFLKPNLQHYAYSFDEFTVVRTNHFLDSFTSETVDKTYLTIGQHSTKTLFLLNIGGEFLFWKKCLACIELTIPLVKTGERNAIKQKADFDFPPELKKVHHSAARHNQIAPISLKLGYRF